MDNQPKTRKESKKDQRQKGSGKDGKYSQKHIRAVEALTQGINVKASNDKAKKEKRDAK